MFTSRERAEQFVASEWFDEAGIVKGQRAEAFIKLLGVCIEFNWIELVLGDPSPPHEWAQGEFGGSVVRAAELHAHLEEVYRDYLDD